MQLGRFIVTSITGIVAIGAALSGCGSDAGDSTFTDPDGHWFQLANPG